MPYTRPVKRFSLKHNILLLLFACAVILFGKSGSASVNKLLAEAATSNTTIESPTAQSTNPLDPIPEAAPATPTADPLPATSPQPASAPTPAAQSSTQPATNTSTATAATSTTETAVVTKVIDGDTIELDSGEKVRYVGMDTPEITKGKNECYGHEASAKNTELVLGKTVTMKKDVSDRDRYGRLLRYIWVGDTFVNAKMIQEGYAAILTIPPDVAQIAYFKQLQAEARTANVGLWSGCGSVHTTTPTTNTSPITGTDCASDKPIKGNASSKIYHIPGSSGYASTIPEACFATETEAEAAGYRKSKN